METPGYDVLSPEGTFYLWSRWPKGDPDRLWNALADRDVFVMPGHIMNTPDYFRISLTASDAMVDRAIPAFEEVARQGCGAARCLGRRAEAGTHRA